MAPSTVAPTVPLMLLHVIVLIFLWLAFLVVSVASCGLIGFFDPAAPRLDLE